VEICKPPFGDDARGEQCSTQLTSVYAGVTVVRYYCVGLQIRTEDDSTVVRTENDELQLKSYYLRR
jgi:hypothetical protein